MKVFQNYFISGAMFPHRTPAKGRLRQFHQIGVEVIGANTATPYLDAEVIALNVELLKTLERQRFSVEAQHARLSRG